MQWIEGGIIGVPNGGDAEAVFINTYTGVEQPPNQWDFCDLTGIVPPDSKAVLMTGMIIITHGEAAEIADFMLTMRKPGDSSISPGNYTAQCIEASTSNGQRSTMFDLVPVGTVNGRLGFEYYWQCKDPTQTWPAKSSYGLNLHLRGYVR